MKSAVYISVLLLSAFVLHADQIEMRNGDRYTGSVVSMTPTNVVIQSEVAGRITLPRQAVANIKLGPGVQTNALASTNAIQLPALPQINATNNSVEQIREQLLKGASPETMAYFNNTVSGLLTGKIDISDIRKQAKSVSDQLRALTKDLPPESAEGFESYLSILEKFLADSETQEPSNTAPTNAAPPIRNNGTNEAAQKK